LFLGQTASRDVAEQKGVVCIQLFDGGRNQDRKSTRLNSSHDQISYAVFCLKKKKKIHITHIKLTANIHINYYIYILCHLQCITCNTYMLHTMISTMHDDRCLICVLFIFFLFFFFNAPATT